MCAAPGSKTSQLMEQVGLNGFVVANDLELTRCHVLMHGVISQPCPQLLITNLDASKFPRLATFDRVLCDVPCSGDGTIRKAREIWGRWSPIFAQALHEVQLKILVRGLQLLKVGGTICYSTCSLNVIENEAVVAAALAICGASVTVQDVSNMHPDVRRAPGLKNWRVGDAKGQFYATYEDVADEGLQKKLCRSMFAPQDPAITEQLAHSMRFYPWLNNSGGFYICILQKVAELPPNEFADQVAKNAMNYEKLNENEDFCANMSRNLPLHPQRRIENPEVVNAIREKFKFKYFFEEGDTQTVLENAAQREIEDVHATRVYVLNKHVQRVLYSSKHAFMTYHIVQAGCGGFERHTGIVNTDKNSYRVESPMAFLLRRTDFVAHISLQMFEKVLKVGLKVGGEESLKFSDTDLPEEVEELRKLPLPGMFLIQIKEESAPDKLLQIRFINELNMSMWIGVASLGFHVKRKARNALHCLLYNVDIEDIVVSGEANRKKAYRERREAQRKGENEGEEKEEE